MRGKPITKEKIKEVIEMRKEGMIWAEIIKRVGISRGSVGRILREHGMVDPKYDYLKHSRVLDEPTENKEDIPKGLEAYKPREIFAYLRLLGYRGKLNFTQEIDI